MTEPAPAPAPDLDAALWAEVKQWTHLRHVGENHHTAQSLIAWALDKGYPLT